MGNSYSTFVVKNSKLVSVDVETLKQRLNKAYNSRGTLSNDSLFEYLWDLKELALMEGTPNVEVPSTWLEDLEETRPLQRTH